MQLRDRPGIQVEGGGELAQVGALLLGVGIDVSVDQYLDLEKEAAAAFALD